MADRSHSPIKVAIFMEFFLPYLGGIERYQDRLSEQLRLLGYDVFTSRPCTTSPAPLRGQGRPAHLPPADQRLVQAALPLL